MQIERNLADLVNSVPPSASSSTPRRCRLSGERSLGVTEELAFVKFARNGHAVHFDKRPLRPSTPPVKLACATSSFPVPLSPRISTEESVGATRINLPRDRLQGRTLPDKLAVGLILLRLPHAEYSFSCSIRFLQLALTVSEANGCEYCLAAHSAVGKMFGLTGDQIHDARHGTSIDPRTDALLRFARKVNETRGKISDDDLVEVREAGFDDGAIAEVIAEVALNVLTNYFNNVAETTVDFPAAAPLEAAGV